MAHEAISSAGGGSAEPPRRRRGWAVALAALTVLVVAAGVWRAWPRARPYYTDGRELRVPGADAGLRDVLWKTPEAVGAGLNSADDEYEPALADSGAEIFFVRGKAGGAGDIYHARRSPGGWNEPVALAGVNSPYDDLGPQLSADGLALYFYSDRSGGAGGYDLWVARRDGPDEEFEQAANLGNRANSSWDEYSPAPAPDGALLYFASNRPMAGATDNPEQHWPATVRENRSRRGYDLYSAAITEAGFGPATPLSALNSPADEGTPAVSPAGDFLYFSSDRAGGTGGFDLYRVRILSSGFGPIEHLADGVNTAANELDPALSMGGFALHFSSDRGIRDGAADAERQYDIYTTVSREVYADAEVMRAGIDWSALLALLTMLLLVLLALLAGRALWTAAQRRRLSLIVRCLLASLLLHALLLALFTVWQVSSSLSGLFKRAGGVRVALTSSAHASELFTQVRGSFSTPPDHPEAVEQNLQAEIILAAAEPAEVALPAPPPAQIDAPAAEPDMAVADARSDPPGVRNAPAGELPELSDAEAPAVALPATAQPVAVADQPSAAPNAAQESAALAPILAALLAEPDVASTGVQLARTAIEEFAAPAATSAADAPVRDADAVAAAQSVPAPSALPADGPRIEFAAPAPSPAQAVREAASTQRPEIAAPASRELRPGFSTFVAAEIPAEAPALPATRVQIASAEDPKVPVHSHDAQSEDLPRSIASGNPVAGLPDFAVDEPRLTTPAVRSGRAAPGDPAQAPQMSAAPLPALRSPLAAQVAPLEDLATELPALSTSTRAPAELPGEWPSAIAADAATPVPSLTPSTAAAPALPSLADGPLALPKFEAPPAPVQVVTGSVIDQRTRAPIAGAEVRLDLPDGAAVTARSDAAGTYTLTVPPVPAHFAISASAQGYLPASASVSAADLEAAALRVLFELEPETSGVVAIEAAPDVHHLGDDRFEGSVNSQFQKRSEGGRYSATFELAADQAPPFVSGGELTMLTRGVQMPHPILINGRPVNLRLTHSPADGSFGEYRAAFDVSVLQAGGNTLEIHALARGGDIDDFEFVNVQVRLTP